MGQVQPGSQVRCKLCFQNSGCAAVIRVFFAKDWKEEQAMLILTRGTCPGHLLVCNPHCAFKRKRKRASIDGDRRIKECYGHLTICENPPHSDNDSNGNCILTICLDFRNTIRPIGEMISVFLKRIDSKGAKAMQNAQ